MISIPVNMVIPEAENGEYTVSTLNGRYAALPSVWGESAGKVWGTIGKWCRKNKIKPAHKQWLEEIEHKGWESTGKIICLFPID